MSNDKDQSFIAENGITIGIIVLAVLVVLAVGLPRWTDDGKSHDTSKVTLPTTLSKGYSAADLKSSYDLAEVKKQGATEQQLTQFLTSTNKQTAAEDRSASNALGFTTASRTYISKDMQKQIAIRAFLGDGSAFFIGSGTKASRVGDDVCYETSGTDQTTGQAQSQAVCSHATTGLTVQATAATKVDAVKYADEIYKKLS